MESLAETARSLAAANVTCLGAIPGCGQLCEFGSADADQCPDRQQCMSPEMLDASDGNAHCSCYAIFGHTQEDCSGVSDKSIFVGVTIGVVAILSASVCCVYFHTIFTYLKNVLGAGEKLKLNSAVSTMLLGMTTALMGVPNMAGYSLSAFQIGDPTMTFHRHWSPKITSLLVMCSIPTMLNVSTMWVDVALRSMAGSGSIVPSRADETRSHRAEVRYVQTCRSRDGSRFRSGDLVKSIAVLFLKTIIFASQNFDLPQMRILSCFAAVAGESRWRPSVNGRIGPLASSAW